jgi:hypothetical protein
MARPKLNADQRIQVIEWLAAGYAGDLIRHWSKERGWPEISDQALNYYRKRLSKPIEAARKARFAAALNTGLALRAERVARLAAHADRLEIIKWEADENGRLWNEKAWRETLDDIARETGGRRAGVSVSLESELESFLDRVREQFDPDTYARIVALAAGSATDSA